MSYWRETIIAILHWHNLSSEGFLLSDPTPHPTAGCSHVIYEEFTFQRPDHLLTIGLVPIHLAPSPSQIPAPEVLWLWRHNLKYTFSACFLTKEPRADAISGVAHIKYAELDFQLPNAKISIGAPMGSLFREIPSEQVCTVYILSRWRETIDTLSYWRETICCCFYPKDAVTNHTPSHVINTITLEKNIFRKLTEIVSDPRFLRWCAGSLLCVVWYANWHPPYHRPCDTRC